MTISYNAFTDDNSKIFFAVAVEIKDKGKCRITAVRVGSEDISVKMIKKYLKKILDDDLEVFEYDTISCHGLNLLQLCSRLKFSIGETMKLNLRNCHQEFQKFICDAFDCFDNEVLEKMLGSKLPPELIAQKGMPLNTKGDEDKRFNAAEYLDKASAPGGLPALKRWGKQK